MNTLLWVAQGLLFGIFLYSGFHKSSKTSVALVAMGQTGVEGLSAGLIRFIGIIELFGAVGIILPTLIRVLPWITPATAVGFAIIMIIAAIIHWKRKEPWTAMGNLFVLGLAVFVAIGRW